MLRQAARQDGRKLAFELVTIRATRAPQAAAGGQRAEAEHLFDTAVAVGGDDQKRTGELARGSADSHDGIVMKFTLLPVIDELVRTPAPNELPEELPQHELRRQRRHLCITRALHPARVAPLRRRRQMPSMMRFQWLEAELNRWRLRRTARAG
jgi:hypothetical protein